MDNRTASKSPGLGTLPSLDMLLVRLPFQVTFPSGKFQNSDAEMTGVDATKTLTSIITDGISDETTFAIGTIREHHSISGPMGMG